jgi:hypothetical protein
MTVINGFCSPQEFWDLMVDYVRTRTENKKLRDELEKIRKELDQVWEEYLDETEKMANGFYGSFPKKDKIET